MGKRTGVVDKVASDCAPCGSTVVVSVAEVDEDRRGDESDSAARRACEHGRPAPESIDEHDGNGRRDKVLRAEDGTHDATHRLRQSERVDKQVRRVVADEVDTSDL